MSRRSATAPHSPPSGRTVRAVIGLMALSLALTACGADAGDGTDTGGTGDDTGGTGTGDEVVVRVVDNDFEPSKVEVDVGDTVVWEFDDATSSHNVTFDELDVESETTDSGRFEWTAEEPGEYTYACTIHNDMEGTVIVNG